MSVRLSRRGREGRRRLKTGERCGTPGATLMALLCWFGAALLPAAAGADLTSARRAYPKAMHAFERKTFGQALALFREVEQALPKGHRLRPTILYYTGRCLEHLSRWKEALAAYQRYLAEAPNDRWVGGVMRRVVELTRRTAGQKSRRGAPATRPAPTRPTSSPQGPTGLVRPKVPGRGKGSGSSTAPRRRRFVIVVRKPSARQAGGILHPPKRGRPSSGLRTAAIVVWSAGLASLGGGVAFAILSRKSISDSQSAYEQGRRRPSSYYTESVMDPLVKADTQITVANVLFITAGAATATGGLLWLLSRGTGPSVKLKPSAHIAPTAGGVVAGLRLAGEF